MFRLSVFRTLLLALPLGLTALAAQAAAQNLIVNGSFEADGSAWFTGNITGWTHLSGSYIEIAPAAGYGVSGQDGNLVVELDGHWPDPVTRIGQVVPTITGRTYTLKFNTAMRAGTVASDNLVNVYVDGVKTVVTPASTVFQETSMTVVATGPTMSLQFENGGAVDTLGSMLDNVSLVASPFDVCPLYDEAQLHKAGSTIPIKIQLCGATGNLSSSDIVLNAFQVVKVGDAGTGTPDDSGNANPDNNFRYDPTLGGTGGYIFNLSTKGLAPGTYILQFTVVGESHIYEVGFAIK